MVNVIGIVVFGLVALFILHGAIREKSPHARAGALIAIAAGIAQGVERSRLALGLLVLSLVVFMVGAHFERRSNARTL